MQSKQTSCHHGGRHAQNGMDPRLSAFALQLPAGQRGKPENDAGVGYLDIPAPLAEPFEPEREAAIRDDAEALMRTAARFVADQDRRWERCSARACRRAKACQGDILAKTGPTCASAETGDAARAHELVVFALIDRINRAARGRL